MAKCHSRKIFNKEVIVSGNFSDALLSELEIHYIRLFCSQKEYSNKGLNLTPGGDGNTNSMGENNSSSKLTTEEVLDIINRINVGDNIKSISNCFKVSPQAVRLIAMGKTWKNTTKELSGDILYNKLKNNNKLLNNKELSEEVLSLYKSGYTMEDCGKIVGLCRSTISKIIKIANV